MTTPVRRPLLLGALLLAGSAAVAGCDATSTTSYSRASAKAAGFESSAMGRGALVLTIVLEPEPGWGLIGQLTSC